MTTHTDKPTDLGKLTAAADKAERQYQAAQAAAEAARQQAEQRRTAALRAHDRERFDAYDDGALEHAEREAEQRLLAAVAEDPLFSALIELQATRIRRGYRHTEATGDASRLGLGPDQTRKLPAVARFPSQPDLEHVLHTVERLAGQIVGEEEDARLTAREAAGDEAANQ